MAVYPATYRPTDAHTLLKRCEDASNIIEPERTSDDVEKNSSFFNLWIVHMFFED